MAERIEQQLGNYRLIRLLGRGGFADTYLGKHVYLESFAAIKVLQAHLQQQDEQTNFLQEARTIARLKHPHIVQVFDYGVDRDMTTPYLVMDYAPNGTLRQRHRRGVPIPLAAVIPYVKQIADALQYAHSQNVIHRDVKPENMLIGANNEVLLSDFGIAILAQNTQSQSSQNIAGTVSYMAPEQLQGKARPASDQYSLAVIVYEWLCGVAPFQGSYIEVAVQHEHTPPAPLRQHMPTIPADVEQVVLTAMSKDPRNRFANILAFARALEHASEAVLPGPRSASTGPIGTTSSAPSSPAIPTPQSSSQKRPYALPTVPAARPTSEIPLTHLQSTNEQTPVLPQSPQKLLIPTNTVRDANMPKLTPHLSETLADSERTFIVNGSAGQTKTAISPLEVSHLSTLLTTTNKVLLGVIALLLILMSSSLLYYTNVYHPNQIHAEATGTVVNGATGTVLARKNATASVAVQATGAAIATTTAGRMLYTQSTSGTPTISDSLNTPSNYGWEDFSDQYGACNYADGAYHVRTQSDSFNPCIALGIRLTNFAMQVEATTISGEFSGLVFRMPSISSNNVGESYEAFIGMSGTYSIDKSSATPGGSKLTTICSGISLLTHTQLNKAYLLTLIAKGSTFYLYIDKQFVTACSDSTYATGNIGLVAGSVKNGTEAIYRNLQIWQL